MRYGLVAVTSAFLFVFGVPDASAQQWVQKTATDSLVIDGIAYPRVSFSVSNRHPTWGFDHFIAHRLESTGPDDTCSAIRAVAPAGWVASLSVSENTVFWWKENGGGVLPGESLGGFQLVRTPGHPACYGFSFAGPIDELSVGGETDCFGSDDHPVPINGRTWGALKARYR